MNKGAGESRSEYPGRQAADETTTLGTCRVVTVETSRPYKVMDRFTGLRYMGGTNLEDRSREGHMKENKASQLVGHSTRFRSCIPIISINRFCVGLLNSVFMGTRTRSISDREDIKPYQSQ